MATSASGVCDALVTMLSAASVFGSGGAAWTYDILESHTGSAAAVISFLSLDRRPVAYGNPTDKEGRWLFSVNLFIKDAGNAKTTLTRVSAAIDAVISCVDADDTLLSTVELVTGLRATRKPDEYIEAGGATWLPVEMQVEGLEL